MDSINGLFVCIDYFFDLSSSVIPTPTTKATTVNPWAAMRARIIICDIRRSPLLKLYRPYVRAAAVKRHPEICAWY